MTETTGNCLAIGRNHRTPDWPGHPHRGLPRRRAVHRVGRIFNSFPYNVYSQTQACLALSRVKSRFAVAAGRLLVLLGFLPKLAA